MGSGTIVKKEGLYYFVISPEICYRLPDQISALSSSQCNEIFIYFARQYIADEGDSEAKDIAQTAYPDAAARPSSRGVSAVREWSRDDFINLLGSDEAGEYSSDSDTDDLKKRSFSEEDMKRSLGFKLRTGPLKRDTLQDRIQQSVELKTLEKPGRNEYYSKQEGGRLDLSLRGDDATLELREYLLQLTKGVPPTEIDLLNKAVSINNDLNRRKSIDEFLTIESTSHGYIIKGQLKNYSNNEFFKVGYKLKNTYCLPMFRGISYLVDRWSRQGRKTHRRSKHTSFLMRFSEAILKIIEGNFYTLASYDGIDKEALQEVRDVLEAKMIALRGTEPEIFAHLLQDPTKVSVAKDKHPQEFRNILELLQYLFSNGIVNFLAFLKLFNESCPGILPNAYNPFLPFSHLPYHAVKYAFGDKDPYSRFVLPVLYDGGGRPRKPFVGRLMVNLHPLSDFIDIDEPDVVPYLVKEAGVSVGRVIGAEWEVSFLAGLREERSISQYTVRWPSFTHATCPKEYAAKYGFDEGFYQFFRKMMTAPEQQKEGLRNLENWLRFFYAIKISDDVVKSATEKGAVILYRHEDGTFNLDFPDETIDNKGSAHLRSDVTSAPKVPIVRTPKASPFPDSTAIFSSPLSTPSPARTLSGRRAEAVTFRDLRAGSLTSPYPSSIKSNQLGFLSSGTIEKSSRSAATSFVGQEIEIDVPGDGSCLYYVVALSILLPVLRDEDRFNEAYVRLFGEGDAEAVKQLREGLGAYNGTPEFISDHTALLEVLVDTHFRGRVVAHMRADILHYLGVYNQHLAVGSPELDTDRFHAYLDRQTLAKSWGGNPEIMAMQKLLGIRVQIQVGDDLRPQNLFEGVEGALVKLRHVGEQGNENHYHFIIGAEHIPVSENLGEQIPSSSSSAGIVATSPVRERGGSLDYELLSAVFDGLAITPQPRAEDQIKLKLDELTKANRICWQGGGGVAEYKQSEDMIQLYDHHTLLEQAKQILTHYQAYGRESEVAIWKELIEKYHRDEVKQADDSNGFGEAGPFAAAASTGGLTVSSDASTRSAGSILQESSPA